MINAFVATPVDVAINTIVPFSGSRAQTRGSCRCNGGSGQFLISRPGIYLVAASAQVTSDAAATVATLALTTNGEALAGTTMAETITAAGDVAQMATTALVTVPCGASITVALANTGAAEVTVNAASLVLVRVA